jgi:uncharacterized protein
MPGEIVLDDLVAIDVHSHVTTSVDAPDTEVNEEFFKYFGAEVKTPTVHDLADYYRERKMAAVFFNVDSTTATGKPPSVSNDEIGRLSAEHRDVLIPFCSVDPHSGKAGAAEVHRVVETYDIRGFKFHPGTQAFYPNDPAFYPILEAIEETGRIALFHAGHTGVGAGQRAGGGIRLKFCNPMFLDDVAVDFPDLPLILAHPAFPWQDEALSVALHKPQVYLDLSGWSPKYFPPNLIQYANTLLRNKVLFGSDFPVITPDRWMADFEGIAIRDEVRPLILKDNAARLLGLAPAS